MSRGARSVAQTKARFTGPPAFPDSLLFSPHGEAKCVRGPSGLGASRAEEKGASRLARAGVLERYVEHGKQAQRSPGGRIACSDRRVVRNAGYNHPRPGQPVFHESRITRHGFYAFHKTRITQHGFSLSLRRLQGEQPQARPTGFSRITRHESRLLRFSSHDFPRFPGISRYFPAPPPPGKGPRAVQSLLSCALWRGMERLWRGMGCRRPPRRQHGP